ncbi:MAG TPA: hypothetical protein PKO02_03235 [Candidatus Pacearchaeota archaeon]|jgi:hypothetical protein|nr:hypothetical protein [Candidatus Pacearchaeota archaeon]
MKTRLSLVTVSIMLVLALGLVAACNDGDYKCIPFKETLIKGEVTYADSGDEAARAFVEVTCIHDGTEYTRMTKTLKYGVWKGWYFVYFPQTQCVAGDEVIVRATKGDLVGEVKGIVEDYITQKCFDLDLARVDVPLVPEFGTIIAMFTALSALGIFFIVRRSN